MAPNAHSLIARALTAIGAWLVMAAVVLSHTQMSQSTTNLMVSGTTRPAFVRPVASNMQGVRRGNVVMRAQFPGSEEEAEEEVPLGHLPWCLCHPAVCSLTCRRLSFSQTEACILSSGERPR